MYACTLHENCAARLRLVFGTDGIWRLYQSEMAHSITRALSSKKRKGIHPDFKDEVKRLCLAGKGKAGVLAGLKVKFGGNPELLKQLPTTDAIAYFKKKMKNQTEHEPIKTLHDVYQWACDKNRYIRKMEDLNGITNPFKVLVLQVMMAHFSFLVL